MIHPLAVVHDTAQVNSAAHVGPFCVIGEQARVGAGTRLMERVSIGPHTILGKDNLVHPGAVIGGDPQDLSFKGETVSCEVGDGNVFRECVTVNRGTAKDMGKTVIGNRNLFMACCHIAHDNVVEDHVVVANGVLMAGHVTLRSGCIISGMVGINQFVTVGRLAYVAGNSGITQDVPPFMKVQGHNSEVRGVNTLGLRRTGVSPDSVEALREAFRILWTSDLTQAEALNEIRAQVKNTPELEELIVFLEQKAKGRFGRARETQRKW
ncbi:MAG: acyl-ACP--UDP-N-acetylglucosamine O-acyltransferase [Planctomycetota bacterium]